MRNCMMYSVHHYFCSSGAYMTYWVRILSKTFSQTTGTLVTTFIGTWDKHKDFQENANFLLLWCHMDIKLHVRQPWWIFPQWRDILQCTTFQKMCTSHVYKLREKLKAFDFFFITNPFSVKTVWHIVYTIVRQ